MSRPRTEKEILGLMMGDSDGPFTDQRRPPSAISQFGTVCNSSINNSQVTIVNVNFYFQSRPEDTGQRPEDTGQRPEDTGQRPEDTEQRPEDTGQRPEGTEQRPEDTGQRPEDTGQRPEDTGQRPEDTEQRPEDTGQRPEDTGQRPEDTGQRPEYTGHRPKGLNLCFVFQWHTVNILRSIELPHRRGLPHPSTL